MKAPSLVKARLPVLDAELSVDGGKYSLHLPHGKHTPEEAVAGIVAPALVAEHGHSMVNAHGQFGVGLLEYAGQLYDVGAPAQVRRLGKVAVREHVA